MRALQTIRHRLALIICPELLPDRQATPAERCAEIVGMLTELQIAELIRALAEARGWSVSHASRVVSGSGDTVSRIDGGIGLTLRRANKIIAETARQWPSGRQWPRAIPRPPKSTKLKEAS